MNPFFSVVTVTLNCKENALLTARSVWAQEAASYEYIVKDGGSRDGTLEALASAGRARIEVSRDRGIYDAMNQALSFCSGEYVLFLNAGDRFIRPDALMRLGRTAREAGFPEVLYTYNGNELLHRLEYYPRHLNRFFLFRHAICHQATYIRRDCFEKFGAFDCSFVMTADDDLLTRLIVRHNTKAVLLPIAAVSYQDGGFSSSSEALALAARERQRIRKQYFTPVEWLLYSTVLLLTLEPLRQRLINRDRVGLYARAQRRFCYLLFGRSGSHGDTPEIQEDSL